MIECQVNICTCTHAHTHLRQDLSPMLLKGAESNISLHLEKLSEEGKITRTEDDRDSSFAETWRII